MNIKNLPDALYRKLQKRPRQQHRSIAQEVTHLLSESLDATEPLSLLELRGLGKEQWRSISAEEHVDNERGSWD